MVEEPTEETNVPESDSLQAFENAQLSLQALTGIQWLKSLGPILWDFDKLQMEFSTNGRKVVLR
ncbi:hypothetical protein A2U01_0042986, partial [Trifolium medium]|nr:hypothetical protein [Trifolium medium]